ncbi:MAG: FAD-dependent oxidoreductase [Anaerococcus sp.]|nr:FAD-dependent oxidoreductase [Anaerococcus sp.]
MVQCLDDFGIPLYFNTTISSIEGDERVTGCTLSQVDENMKVIPGTEKHFDCDTILLSVGLLPENELTKEAKIEIDPKTKGAVVSDRLMTNVDGVFAAGNVLHVHDLVDYVTEESELAAKNAADYIKDNFQKSQKEPIYLKAGDGISYTLPQYINPDTMQDEAIIRFRVNNVYQNRILKMFVDGKEVTKKRKLVYAPGEMENLILKKKDINEDTKEIEIKLEEI